MAAYNTVIDSTIKDRSKLETELERYLRTGGSITELPIGYSGLEPTQSIGQNKIKVKSQAEIQSELDRVEAVKVAKETRRKEIQEARKTEEEYKAKIMAEALRQTNAKPREASIVGGSVRNKVVEVVAPHKYHKEVMAHCAQVVDGAEVGKVETNEEIASRIMASVNKKQAEQEAMMLNPEGIDAHKPELSSQAEIPPTLSEASSIHKLDFTKVFGTNEIKPIRKRASRKAKQKIVAQVLADKKTNEEAISELPANFIKSDTASKSLQAASAMGSESTNEISEPNLNAVINEPEVVAEIVMVESALIEVIAPIEVAIEDVPQVDAAVSVATAEEAKKNAKQKEMNDAKSGIDRARTDFLKDIQVMEREVRKKIIAIKQSFQIKMDRLERELKTFYSMKQDGAPDTGQPWVVTGSNSDKRRVTEKNLKQYLIAAKLNQEEWLASNILSNTTRKLAAVAADQNLFKAVCKKHGVTLYRVEYRMRGDERTAEGRCVECKAEFLDAKKAQKAKVQQ